MNPVGDGQRSEKLKKYVRRNERTWVWKPI